MLNDKQYYTTPMAFYSNIAVGRINSSAPNIAPKSPLCFRYL